MKMRFGLIVVYRLALTEYKLATITAVHSDTCATLVVEGEQVFRTSVVLGLEVGQFQFRAE